MNTVSPSHAEWEELAALAALGALDPGDRAGFAAHLESCADCRQAFDDYRAVARNLERSAPAAVAPPGLEARILAQARAGQAADREPGRTLAPENPRRRRGAIGRAMAAAVLAALLFGGYRLARPDAQGAAWVADRFGAISEILPGADARPIALVSASGQVRGQFIWTPQKAVASMTIEGLPAKAGRKYYLWLIRKDGGGDHIGAYESGADGTIGVGVTAPHPWPTYQQIIITDNESHDYHEQPTSGILMGDF